MERFYLLRDYGRNVKIEWRVNTTFADITSMKTGKSIGGMGILMVANPTILQFQTYVENVIDEVLAGYEKAAAANG